MRARSLLFIPASKPALVAKAHLRAADIVILDLEDGVAQDEKASARHNLAASIATLQSHALTVWLRINPLTHGGYDDLAALKESTNLSLMLAKTETQQDIKALEAALDRDRPLIALIENPAGFFNAITIINASPLMAGLAFGGEDFAADAGLQTTPEALSMPAQMIALAAASKNCPAYGLAGSLANYHDLHRFEQEATYSHRLGMSGALCIHPAQVSIANKVFQPSAAEIEWATTIMREARADGAMASSQGMIDAPVVKRAITILTRKHSA